jgi:hypothetical protein
MKNSGKRERIIGKDKEQDDFCYYGWQVYFVYYADKYKAAACKGYPYKCFNGLTA